MGQRGGETHDKGLVEVGAEQAFLPVVAHRAPHGVGDGLLDAVGDPRLVVEELWVRVDVVSTRRREAHRGDRRRRGDGWGRGGGGLPVDTGRLGAPDGAVLIGRGPGGGGGGGSGRRLGGCRRGTQRDGGRGQGGRVTRSVAGGPPAQARAGAKAVDRRRRRRGRACRGDGDGRCCCCGGCLRNGHGGLDVRDYGRGQVRGRRRRRRRSGRGRRRGGRGRG